MHDDAEYMFYIDTVMHAVTNLKVGHSPIAEVDRVVRVCLDGTGVTSNCTIKVSRLECFICLCFEILCLSWVPGAFAVTWTCTTT